MLKGNLILFLIFYILTLFQAGLLFHFFPANDIPNLVLIFLFLVIFFTTSQGIIHWEVIYAGFFLDLFSDYPLGFSIIIFYLDFFLIKNLLKHFEKSNIFLFFSLFLLFLLFYDVCVFLLEYFMGLNFVLDKRFLTHLIYNSIFAFLGLIFYKYVLSRNVKTS